MSYASADEMYNGLPEHVKEDLFEAITWAKEYLRDREGSGHQFHIHATKDRLLQCSFAKPQWSGDHCSRPMDEAAQAICMAVCEYVNGC